MMTPHSLATSESLPSPPTEFFSLFLDSSLSYSSAYFEHETMSLADAQRAKADRVLEKCGLEPGRKLLDIGCGWGALARRAAERYGAIVIGLTISPEQARYDSQMLRQSPVTRGHVEIRLQDWKDYNERVDRITCIAAFESFDAADRADFLVRCRALLPDDGRMVLQTVTASKNWFRVCSTATVLEYATLAGFSVDSIESLTLHYAQTLEHFARNLVRERKRAIEITSQSTYAHFVRYYSKSAEYLRAGLNELLEFTLCAE